MNSNRKNLLITACAMILVAAAVGESVRGYYLDKYNNADIDIMDAASIKDAYNNNPDSVQEEYINPIVEYGKEYARFVYENVGIDAMITWGDDDSLLSNTNTICQYAKSSPLGTKGSHLLLTHNHGLFHAFENARVGDSILINIGDNEYKYEVQSVEVGTVTDDSSTITGKDGESLVRYDGEEDELYMYTCYPLDRKGDTNKRLVVYAVPENQG